MNLHTHRNLSVGAISLLILAFCTSSLLAKEKTSSKPWIGVYMQDVTSDLADAFDLSVKKGVLINDVADGSPADKAGLKAKDVILAWNGKTVTSSDQLTEMVTASTVGDNAKLTINRKGKEMEIAVQVGERKEPRRYERNGDEEGNGNDDYQNLDNLKSTGIGVSLQSLSGDLGDYFGVAEGKGALITKVMKDTPAAKAGLKAGDVIVKVDGEDVETPGDVSGAIGDKEKGDKVDLVIVRDKAEKSMSMEVDEIESFGALDLSGMPGMPDMRMFRWNGNAPHAFHFNMPDQGDMQKKMEELQNKLEEMQKKLEKLETRMK